MTNKKAIQSHIQMPKCVLRRFENAQHMFYYYDVQKNFIGNHGRAKSINTQLGYYSEDMEKYLNSTIEKPFSDILQYLDSIDFGLESFSIPVNFLDTVKQYAIFLIARDPAMFASIKRHSFYFQFFDECSCLSDSQLDTEQNPFSEQHQHDLSIFQGIDAISKHEIFDNYFWTFTVNTTDTPFVLPISGLYSYNDKNFVNHIIFPISPQLAITLVEKNGLPTLQRKNKISMYLLENENVVECFNRFAFETQFQKRWGYVVSPKEDILKKLKKREWTT